MIIKIVLIALGGLLMYGLGYLHGKYSQIKSTFNAIQKAIREWDAEDQSIKNQ